MNEETKQAEEQPKQDAIENTVSDYSDVQIQETEYLYFPWFIRGKLTARQGDTDTGKSTFLYTIGAYVSQGKPIFGIQCEAPGNVMFVTLEDSESDIKTAFQDAGGDMSKLRRIRDRKMRGVLPYPPPEGINPGELTTFGLMNDTEESSIHEMIHALLDQGYLEQNDDNCLVLNDQSREILFSKRRIVMKRGTKVKTAIGGEDLFQALQRLRYEISSKEYVAASALFSDSTLRDICRILPRTKKQLAAVDGMGLFKANRYGDEILPVIRRYAPEPDTQEARETEKQTAGKIRTEKAGEFLTYKDKVIAKGSIEAYQPWTKEEDKQLIREHQEGKTTKEMSVIHKRTTGAIRSRLKKLELT